MMIVILSVVFTAFWSFSLSLSSSVTVISALYWIAILDKKTSIHQALWLFVLQQKYFQSWAAFQPKLDQIITLSRVGTTHCNLSIERDTDVIYQNIVFQNISQKTDVDKTYISQHVLQNVFCLCRSVVFWLNSVTKRNTTIFRYQLHLNPQQYNWNLPRNTSICRVWVNSVFTIPFIFQFRFLDDSQLEFQLMGTWNFQFQFFFYQIPFTHSVISVLNRLLYNITLWMIALYCFIDCFLQRKLVYWSMVLRERGSIFITVCFCLHYLV